MDSSSHHFRHLALVTLKIVIGVALISYLIWQAQSHEAFQQLVEQPKRWNLLAGAVALSAASVVLSFVRWQWVVNAAGVPLNLGEALRLGALGFALNFVSPGAFGGDVFKAIYLARGRAGRRAAAVTSIFVDRALALISMLLFASLGFIWVWSSGIEMPAIATNLGRISLMLTALTPVGFSLLFLPGVLGPTTLGIVRRAPLVGSHLAEAFEAWHEYRKRLKTLASALALCLVVDLLVVLAFYCVAIGLPLSAPSLAHHLFIVPFGFIVGAIPISPSGLGTIEATVELFYRWSGVQAGAGALVAFGHRLTLLAVGGVAIVYYLTHQAVVRETMLEADAASAPV